MIRRLVLAACLLAGVARAGEGYEIVVKTGERQRFAGFGASQVSKEFGHFAPEPFRSQMADLVYRDLKATILRLWVASGPEVGLDEMKARFYADYVDDGVIPLLQARGVKTLLLAPARGMEAPRDSIPGYAAKLARFIAEIREERGVGIAVTGIANEPEGWSGEQLAEAIKCLRAELDRRGLSGVEIIAPESPSANEAFDAQMDVIRRDPEAWAALRGVSTHSYNMAARASSASRSEGKEYWMTEASDDGNEHGEDESRAASIAARFLNDLNHLVTHWIFFKGFSYSPDVARDDYTASRISQYDAATGAIVTHLKYYYLRQFLSAFDVGAVFRRCESKSEGGMVFTYGQKPRICAAAARNPDGSWAIGVVNLTGVTGSNEISQWHPAEELEVTIRVEELAGVRKFRVRRSGAGRHDVDSGSVEMRDGRVTVSLRPMELLTLREEVSVQP